MRQYLSLFGLAVLVRGFVPTTNHQPRPSKPFKSLSASVDSCDVAVFGGGFGGLYTALAISREARRSGKKLDVALVEPTETFVFLPLLYDLTVGTATEIEVCPAYNDLLRGTGVRHVRASLQSLDEAGDRTTTASRLNPTNAQAPKSLNFRAGVVAVGAAPDSILASVPGATEYAQPFYTAPDAKRTRRLLNRLEEQMNDGVRPKIAVVGGGFGGVELAASVKRRLSDASVTLLSRGAPMAGTRAEALVDKALQKLGVIVEESSVEAIESEDDKLLVRRKSMDGEPIEDETRWDAVLWTAGSGPADPVPNGCKGIMISRSGRLAIDPTLRCQYEDESNTRGGAPRLWSLGDCAEVVKNNNQPAIPKTAQAAMQQADVVASNLLAQLEVKGRTAPAKTFAYQDLGSMLMLGGPNGAVLAPREGTFAPIFAPLLDTVDGALRVGDEILSTVGRSPLVEQMGLSPETLGLSLGSHGLGVDNGAAPGTLAGTLTGAARRTVYAVRMPTNQQRAVSLVSAAISTAAALAKEASDRNKK